MGRFDDAVRKGLAHEVASPGGGGDGMAPFVKWGDTPCEFGGTIKAFFKTRYGLSCFLAVDYVEGDIPTAGKGENGEHVLGLVEAGHDVAIGLSASTLVDKITEDDKGRQVLFRFEGWVDGKENRFRDIRVALAPLVAAPPQTPRSAPPPGHRSRSLDDGALPF